MEATTLKKKKQVNKGKLRKTMKNVICRPDPNFWPQTSEDKTKIVIGILNKLKVDIPEFKKPLWSELRHIPKKLRPKAPAIPRVEGLIFGIAECQKAIENKECMGVLIESAVNPKTIVHPLIEMCIDKSVPVLCLKELRLTTKINFGIPTSVLGVKQSCLPELEKMVIEISKNNECQTRNTRFNIAKEEIIPNTKEKEEIMDVDDDFVCPYLYRTDKKTRVFTPSLNADGIGSPNNFVGQNFIKVSNDFKDKTESKQYLKMIVKKISSNANRKKITKDNPKE